MPESQRWNDPEHDRNDHVWEARWRPAERGEPDTRHTTEPDFYKCLLCGAVTEEPPPPYPTPGDWMPARYDLPLSRDERGRLPIHLGTRKRGAGLAEGKPSPGGTHQDRGRPGGRRR